MKKGKKIIIYQVFTRLFGNENQTNKKNGSLKENGVGKFNNFSDRALQEIKKLGVTHIWYTGILEHATKTDYTKFGIEKNHSAVVKGKAGSPYAIKDYYDVCPDLAVNVKNRMQEFESLVARTHHNKLQLIIDFVPNHVAREYKSDAKPTNIEDLGETDNISTNFNPQNNFYYLPGQSFEGQLDLYAGEKERYNEFPAKSTGNDCFHNAPNINDWYETIKLNYGIDYLNGGYKHFNPIPNTWIKMKDILLFWAEKKVDGFRCDMAEMVPVEFWEWAIPQVKEKYPEILFIAEVYDPSKYKDYLFKGKFDYLYDKVGLYDTLRGVTCGYISSKEITRCWQNTEGIQERMLNFMENHDEQRIASDFFSGNGFFGVPSVVVSSCMNTNPFMVYFGQELGEKGMDEEGFSGKDGRTSIFDYWCLCSINRWINKGNFGTKQLDEDEKNLQKFYKKVLNICLKEKAINSGSFYDLMWLNIDNKHFDSDKQYAFLRKKDNDLLLVVVNFDSKAVSIQINIPDSVLEFLGIDSTKGNKAKDLLSDTEEAVFSSCIPIELEKNGSKILKYSF